MTYQKKNLCVYKSTTYFKIIANFNTKTRVSVQQFAQKK